MSAFSSCRKITVKEDLWEAGQALKVLAFADLRYLDNKAFWEAVKYEPYPREIDICNKEES